MFKYKIFKTPKGTYLYDGVTANVFEIDEYFAQHHKQLFGTIEMKHDTQTKDEIFEAKLEEIQTCIESGSLSPVSNDPIHYWFDEKEYLSSIEKEICQLMIGVTEKCNMRCRYCVYGGHYENERTHGDKNISNTTLHNAIDYFFKLSKNRKRIVNFYGGEPFANFAAIKEAVNYILTIDDSVTFYITTNGTLIDEDVQEWFLSHKNVVLYVSLAGIPKRHDELRIFANKQPTFEKIKDRLLRLKQKNEKEFNERVHFIFNIFDAVQLFEIQEFFASDALFKGAIHIPEVSYIDCYDDDGNIKQIRKGIIEQYTNAKDPIQEYVRRLRCNDHDNIFVKHFDDVFLRIHRRNDGTENAIAGVCRPFAKKLFVDIHGCVHLCENFTNGSSFGQVTDSFPIAEVSKLLKEYRENRDNVCQSCWAMKLCSLCYRDLYNRDGEVDRNRAEDVCNHERQGLEKLLQQYCEILEESPDILDHLDNYTVCV